MVGEDAVSVKVYAILSRRGTFSELSIDASTPLAAMCIDLVGRAEILFDIEEAFDIEIPESHEVVERFRCLTTAGATVELVRGLVAAKEARA